MSRNRIEAMARARALGFLIPRRQHAIKRIDDMTGAELRALLGEDDANGHCAGRFE